jgi:redox-sensitive bicupin YhaK (pirin superfamily)
MKTVLEIRPLGFPWETADPFLFCAYHDDAYPRGNEKMGPDASLAGRDLGQDFEGKDGWRMYHGRTVPGFPQHPHRGFETVTVVRRGLVDHSDSLGATARYGHGDVQWLTAGAGVVHCEMFPLVDREHANPLELFQIWLNLPREDKMAKPHFGMLWNKDIPRHEFDGGVITMVAGALEGKAPPAPPPKSWAARPESDVAIWTIKLQGGAKWTMPAAHPDSSRTLYLFRGSKLKVDGTVVSGRSAIALRSDAAITLDADDACELLMLRGKPIGEPVAAYGPFVMNDRQGIEQAFADYRRTKFGGWPWPSDDPVHPPSEGRFAKHADGRVERA